MADKEGTPGNKTIDQLRLRDYLRAIFMMFARWVRRNFRTILKVAAVLIVLLLALQVWRHYHQNPVLNNDQLIISVSRRMNISGDPNPAILTVINQEKVNQPFLDESKEGDKILLYYKAQKAVLYRPGQDKIIKSGNFTPPAASVQIRQGTTNAQRPGEVEAIVKTIVNTTIKTRDSSTLTDYAQTIVINATDRYDAEAAALAKALGAVVRTIPQTEAIPDADILIIVGAK